MAPSSSRQPAKGIAAFDSDLVARGKCCVSHKQREGQGGGIDFLAIDLAFHAMAQDRSDSRSRTGGRLMATMPAQNRSLASRLVGASCSYGRPSGWSSKRRRIISTIRSFDWTTSFPPLLGLVFILSQTDSRLAESRNLKIAKNLPIETKAAAARFRPPLERREMTTPVNNSMSKRTLVAGQSIVFPERQFRLPRKGF